MTREYPKLVMSHDIRTKVVRLSLSVVGDWVRTASAAMERVFAQYSRLPCAISACHAGISHGHKKERISALFCKPVPLRQALPVLCPCHHPGELFIPCRRPVVLNPIRVAILAIRRPDVFRSVCVLHGEHYVGLCGIFAVHKVDSGGAYQAEIKLFLYLSIRYIDIQRLYPSKVTTLTHSLVRDISHGTKT